MKRPLVAIALGMALLFGPNPTARADEPGPDTLPITVVAVQTGDADDQAEALTKALRNAVRTMPGWSLGEGDYSLEVLALSMKCAEPPDAACESRIADQIKADRYVWGIISKKGGSVSGELHLWVRGKGTAKVNVNYGANLTEANDEALKKVANDAIVALTGGPPKGTVHVKAGDVSGQVFVDGTPLGALNGGEGTFPLPAGSHKVVVKAQGYADAEAIVVVKPNGTAEVSLHPSTAEPDTPTNWRLVGGIAGLGAGVGFGIVGLISTLQVNGIQNDDSFADYRKKHPDSKDVCEDAKAGASDVDTKVADQCSKGSTFEALQVIFYSLAAVSGGVGIYLLATSSRSDSAAATGLTVQPSIGKQSGRLDVTYRF